MKSPDPNRPRSGHPKVVTPTIQGPLFCDENSGSGDQFDDLGDHWVTTFSDSGHPKNPQTTSANAERVTGGDHFSLPFTCRAGAGEKVSGNAKTGHPVFTLKDLKQLAGRATGRGVHAIKCRTCHQPILTGLDDDYCAIPASCDFTPLDSVGEFLALISGRRTYRLDLQQGGNPKLTKRRAADIRKPRKYFQRYDVIPTHQCGAAPLATIESRLAQAGLDLDPNQPCPY